MNPGLPTRRQIAMIARQEGEDADVVREALRRMGDNPRVRCGEVRSPAAFFRGIVRGVLADHEPPAAATSGAVPPRLGARDAMPSPPPDASVAERVAGRMALRARRLFADGADRACACQNSRSSFRTRRQTLSPGPSSLARRSTTSEAADPTRA